MSCAPFTLVPEDAHQLGDQLSHGASPAREGQDSAIFGGPGRARVLRTPPPGRAERVLPVRSRKPDESPAGPGNPLGHWPSRVLRMSQRQRTGYLSRALEVQGKWGPDSTSLPPLP